MSIQIGTYTFEDVAYNSERDILVLGQTGEGEETPEGHVVHYEFGGDRVIGVELQDVRAILERSGTLWLTLPDGERIDAAQAAAPITA